MNKIPRFVLTLVFVAGLFGTTAYHGYKLHSTKRSQDELFAPVAFNIEIRKEAASYLSLWSGDELFTLMSTSDMNNELRNTVLFTALRAQNFYPGIFLLIPKEHTEETLQAIDNITVFAGNKLIYYSAADIQKFSQSDEKYGYARYKLPELFYEKNFGKIVLSNWYGDFNFFIKGICEIFVYPAKFIGFWFFAALLIILYKSQLTNIYVRITKMTGASAGPGRQRPFSEKRFEVILVLSVLLLGFVFRFNGYVRHSAWYDELYSAVVAGNPNLPLISTFVDPGNPPFYFMLLRFWFKIFGWSEKAGTLLSVLMGTGAVLSLYCLAKKFLNKKIAFLAAFFMAISSFAIGYSQEMRCYILKMLLVPILSILFINFLKNPSFKKLCLYILPCIIIINTHYYGTLFVIANYLFFIILWLLKRNHSRKTAVMFTLGNIVAGITFIPFLVIRWSGRISNLSEKPDIVRMVLQFGLIIMVFTLLAVIYLKYIKNEKAFKLSAFFNRDQVFFLEYVYCIVGAMFLLVCVFSFFIPIHNNFPNPYRYFALCFPYALIFVSAAVYVTFAHKKLKYFSLFFIYALVIFLYEARSGGDFGWYKECRSYIAFDAAAHPDRNASVFDGGAGFAAFYGFTELPVYSAGKNFDVLYLPTQPSGMREDDLYLSLFNAGLDTGNILKIRVNDERVILKKFFAR